MREVPHARILILTQYEQPEYVRRFLQLALPFKPVNLGDARNGGALRPSRGMNPLSHWRRSHTPDFQAVIEGFRRMTFNVLAVNQDDHVKNLSFHMDATGAWSLTPAYDLTFAKGGGWTASHQMRVAGKRSGIERADLIGVAETFGIRNPSGIVDRIAEVFSRWPEYARETGVPEEAVRRILRSGWVTQGPEVARFEADFAQAVGATHACAVSS